MWIRRKIFRTFLVALSSIVSGFFITTLSLRIIVWLSLSHSVSAPSKVSTPVTILSLPEETDTEKRERKRPEPEIEPETEKIPQNVIKKEPLKAAAIKPMKIAGFKPNVSIVGNFRLSPGDFASSGPARGLMPVFQSPPQYPYKARQRGIEGMVELEFTITKEGSVKEIEIIKADPPHVFNRAAIQALARWRFKPKERGGNPIEQRAIQQIRFELGGRS